jgi:hypothetical protein
MNIDKKRHDTGEPAVTMIHRALNDDLPTIFSPAGVYDQNEYGIFDAFEEDKILAPFNIESSIDKNGELLVQVTSLSNDKKSLTRANFRSEIELWDALPKAALEACKFVEHFKEHTQFLIELILSDVGVLLYHDTLVDFTRCHELTHALYTLNEMKEFADHIQYIRANPEHWTPGTPI